jgi:hypothetical protein
MNIPASFLEYKVHAIATLAAISLFCGGRLSVSAPDHAEECAPELGVIVRANAQIAELRLEMTQAESRGLHACVEREEALCRDKMQSADLADDQLDCLVCAARCQ